MVEKIRLATPEEIKEIEPQANLTPTCRVLAMGDMRAVWRIAHELDPLIAKEPWGQKVYKFIWGIENIMAGAGVSEYYFNTPADDPKYHRVIEEFGGQRLSKQPDYRWRVNL